MALQRCLGTIRNEAILMINGSIISITTHETGSGKSLRVFFCFKSFVWLIHQMKVDEWH